MKARNWIALVAGVVVALGASYAAYTLANFSWNQVVDYRGPYAGVELPAGRAPSAPPRDISRVVYVIVDGLREDASRTMPTMEQLRRRGFDALVRTSQPSLSFPNWTTLLSGAPQRISGVTTNWFDGHVPVETLVDVALIAKRTVVVSAPKDFEKLYGVQRTGHVFLRDWTAGEYMSAEIVDNAIRLTAETSPSIVLVHLPDVDEAGHASGAASPEYAATAMKVDADLGRLVGALQDGHTVFVVTADHGHIATGGHGGWEPEVIDVPAVFAGQGIRLGKGMGTQDQIGPTVALLAGLPALRNSIAAPLDVVVDQPAGSERFDEARLAAYTAYIDVVQRAMPAGSPRVVPSGIKAAPAAFEAATQARLAAERTARLPQALALAGVALAVVLVVGLLSWRGLVSALAGTIAYFAFYSAFYFGLHRYGPWSLSSFNSESMLKGFMNARMIEAIIAGVLAVAVAADVYLVTRREPRRPKGEFLPGWLALGVATALVIQAALGLQIAWYLWRWGAALTWYIPNLGAGFKYDLDLIQATAIGAVALLGPVVAYLVGRYHPLRERAAVSEPQATGEGA